MDSDLNTRFAELSSIHSTRSNRPELKCSATYPLTSSGLNVSNPRTWILYGTMARSSDRLSSGCDSSTSPGSWKIPCEQSRIDLMLNVKTNLFIVCNYICNVRLRDGRDVDRIVHFNVQIHVDGLLLSEQWWR